MTIFEAFGIYFAIGLAAVLVCGLLYLVVSSTVWAYHDAEERGKPGWLVALLVLLCKWPVSLLLWVAVRPPLAEAGNGQVPDA